MKQFSRWRRIDAGASDQLNSYLDDRASGVPAPGNGIDTGLADTVSRVHQADTEVAAPHRLKADIWEELMSTSAFSDPGSMAAPLPSSAPRSRAVDHRTTTIPSGVNGSRPLPADSRFRVLHWTVAAIVLLGIAGSGFIFTRSPQGTPPPTRQASLMAPSSGTPQAAPENATYPPASDCTVPVLRINEIAAIVWDAEHGSELEVDMRDFPSSVPDMETAKPPLPDGGPVDEKTAAAINDVYYTYIACANAGSVRQQFWLFTFDGIARALIPDGNALYLNIATLGVEPSPVANNAVPLIPFDEMRLLPDDRVAGIWNMDDPDQTQNFVLFREINGQWYIDDRYCGTCG